MDRMCAAGCGTSLAGRTPRARFCSSDCRAKATKRRRKGQPEDIGTGVVVPFAPPPDESAPPVEPDGPVTRSTLDVLTRAERVSTPSGQVALALARRIDKAADSGSSLAALARQLSETMTEALVGVVLEPDKVDELRARRDAKLRGA